MEGNGGLRKRPSSSSSSTMTTTECVGTTKRAEVDNEQTKDQEAERFFELLGNIKALKDSFELNKRMKKQKTMTAKPLWRPVFKMEDFRDDCEVESSWISGVLNPPKMNNTRNCSVKNKTDVEDDEEESAVVVNNLGREQV